MNIKKNKISDNDNSDQITVIVKNSNMITDLNLVKSNTEEEQINIYKLQKYGYFIIDSKLMSTAFCKSKITYINARTSIFICI